MQRLWFFKKNKAIKTQISCSLSVSKDLLSAPSSVKIGHDWQRSGCSLAGKVTNRRGQLVRRLKNGRSSVIWGQGRLPGPPQSADLPPTGAASGCHGGRAGGPGRHLHVLPWPSSAWVITLSHRPDNCTPPMERETRWGVHTSFPEMTYFGDELLGEQAITARELKRRKSSIRRKKRLHGWKGEKKVQSKLVTSAKKRCAPHYINEMEIRPASGLNRSHSL